MIYVGIYADHFGTFPRNIQFIHHQLKSTACNDKYLIREWRDLNRITSPTYAKPLSWGWYRKTVENVNKKKAAAEEQRHFGSLWQYLTHKFMNFPSAPTCEQVDWLYNIHQPVTSYLSCHIGVVFPRYTRCMDWTIIWYDHLVLPNGTC